jgi:M6 family metalloprotease-like protein
MDHPRTWTLLLTAATVLGGFSAAFAGTSGPWTTTFHGVDPAGPVLGVPSQGTVPTQDTTGGDEETTAPGGPDPTGFDTVVGNPQVGTRPLLVILLDFTDLVHDPVLTPTFVRNQIFGPRPSLNDYYLETSYGQFSFSDQGNWAWITAWDDPGTSGDESTIAYWGTPANECCGGGGFMRWALRSLDVAGYNFAPRDTNSDGKISFGQELAYLLIYANAFGNFDGRMRGMPGGLSLDGKSIEGAGCLVASGVPWITLYAHELAHQFSSGGGGAHFLTDYYGILPQNIGQFTLMGFSGFGSSPSVTPNGPHHLDPYSKLKLGWYPGTVVSADGFVSIPNAETTATAFILHEPAHGKDEYFMVENRWKGTSYDNTDALIGPLPAPFNTQGAAADIPDEGLLIWHIDETRDWNGSTTGGFAKVDLIRRGGGDGNAAFDGSDGGYYDFHDGSSPENAKWNGGADSKTGVWCVSPKAATMTAYLDVPGPGVLVCSAPLSASAVPGSAATVTVPVRNTGDATDTFEIIASAPSDVVVALPSSTAIASKALSNRVVQLTPVRACTTAPGPRVITLTARSTTNNAIAMSITVTLTVLPFSEPEVTLTVLDGDVEPTETGTYTVNVVNHGNVLDMISLSFTAVDFGSAYRALPTAIPMAWVALGAPSVTAAACAGGSTSLAIAIPPDWAAMEDATYQFTLTAVGGVTSDSDAVTGSLLVRATPVSMMFYVKVEIANLEAEVLTLPPSDGRDGLQDKTTAALEKLCQALDRYLLGDDPPAANLVKATMNKVEAFIRLVDAQDGKALTPAQAASLRAQANQILADLAAILAAM